MLIRGEIQTEFQFFTSFPLVEFNEVKIISQLIIIPVIRNVALSTAFRIATLKKYKRLRIL